VPGLLFDLGSYPGAVLDESAPTRIEGELWEARYTAGMFRQLDEYEEFFPARLERSLFVRAKARIHLSRSRTATAWIYVLRNVKRSAPVIATGAWGD
jgi:gamma-glutamylcyclotransferase (GGCT)/AIG2-like uncharacterized protein YtfP